MEVNIPKDILLQRLKEAGLSVRKIEKIFEGEDGFSKSSVSRTLPRVHMDSIRKENFHAISQVRVIADEETELSVIDDLAREGLSPQEILQKVYHHQLGDTNGINTVDGKTRFERLKLAKIKKVVAKYTGQNVQQNVQRRTQKKGSK